VNKSFKIGEYLAKLQAGRWLSRAPFVFSQCGGQAHEVAQVYTQLFYRLAARSASGSEMYSVVVCPSVRPPVCHKKAKRKITLRTRTLHISPWTVVFAVSKYLGETLLQESFLTAAPNVGVVGSNWRLSRLSAKKLAISR